MFWFYRRRVTGRLQTSEFLMNGGIRGRDGQFDILWEPVRGQQFVQSLLLSDGAIPVDTATSKETMLDHAVAEEDEEDR